MFWNVQNIRIGPANRSPFVLRRIASPKVVSIHVSSYWFVYHGCTFASIRCLSAVTQYVAIWCPTIALWYWIAHVHIGSSKFLLDPIVFSSHHSTIVLIIHHHRTALYCIVSPSWCILLHLAALYQFVFNSCLIRIDSQIIVLVRHRGTPGTNHKFLRKKSPPFTSNVIPNDSYNYTHSGTGV